MAQSLNVKVDFTGEAIAYLGFAEYGQIMIGDCAFEFFNDRSAENNMQFPWQSIERVEGNIFKSFGGKQSVGKSFSIIFHNGKRVRFSSKDSGTILKFIRQYIGNDKVVKARRFIDIFKRFRKKKRV